MDEVSEARLEAKRDFAELLDSDYGRETGEGLYVKKIDDIIKKYPETKTVRLDVDVQGGCASGCKKPACLSIAVISAHESDAFVLVSGLWYY